MKSSSRGSATHLDLDLAYRAYFLLAAGQTTGGRRTVDTAEAPCVWCGGSTVQCQVVSTTDIGTRRLTVEWAECTRCKRAFVQSWAWEDLSPDTRHPQD